MLDLKLCQFAKARNSPAIVTYCNATVAVALAISSIPTVALLLHPSPSASRTMSATSRKPPNQQHHPHNTITSKYYQILSAFIIKSPAHCCNITLILMVQRHLSLISELPYEEYHHHDHHHHIVVVSCSCIVK